MGLGSALYAMAKADGRLQSEETETLRMLLLNDPDARPALEAFDIQDKYDVPAEEAYEYALRRFQAHRKHLDEATKKRFVGIMEQLANAFDDTSRKENELLKRFRRDLKKL